MEVVSGDYWSYKTCKAAVKMSPSTNKHPALYRPDALPFAQPTVSKDCLFYLHERVINEQDVDDGVEMSAPSRRADAAANYDDGRMNAPSRRDGAANYDDGRHVHVVYVQPMPAAGGELSLSVSQF